MHASCDGVVHDGFLATCYPCDGLLHLRHKAMREMLADLLTYVSVSPGVATDSLLLPLKGKTFHAAWSTVPSDAWISVPLGSG